MWGKQLSMPRCVFQVSGRCQCTHHTAGDHCEKCAPLYNDRPWRPANSTSGESNACQSKWHQLDWLICGQSSCRRTQSLKKSFWVHKDSAKKKVIRPMICLLSMFPAGFCSPSSWSCLSLSLSHLSITVDSYSSVSVECQCHGHADSCHFSHRAWLSSGGTSGGVCDECRHNTVGRRCQRCRHGYRRHPSLPLSSPHACTRKRHRMGQSLRIGKCVFSQRSKVKELPGLI